MAHRDIVVIGASAGGIHALTTVLEALPRDFGAAVFVTLHTGPEAQGYLADVLSRSSALPVTYVYNSEPIKPGQVYVARPNLHLFVRRGHVENRFLPKENRARPAIDPMFRSAARAYGKRVIGVLLTGFLDDGTDGLGIIKDEGGTTVVQDPNDAQHADMPLSAVTHVKVDRVVPLAGIAPLLVELTRTEVKEEKKENHKDDLKERDQVLVCPGCGGVLREYGQKDRKWFECQVGHRYSLQSMMVDQDREVEGHLWGAVAMLRQKEDVARTMAADARSQVKPSVSPDFYEKQAEEARNVAEMLTNIIEEKGEVLFSHPSIEQAGHRVAGGAKKKMPAALKERRKTAQEAE